MKGDFEEQEVGNGIADGRVGQFAAHQVEFHIVVQLDELLEELMIVLGHVHIFNGSPILNQGFESVDEVLVEDHSSVAIGLVVNANVVMFGLLVEMLDSRCRVDWVHVIGFLQVLGGRVVCVVGLDEADGRMSRDLKMKNSFLVKLCSLVSEFI